jgi:predicted nucleotidyltransferase
MTGRSRRAALWCEHQLAGGVDVPRPRRAGHDEHAALEQHERLREGGYGVWMLDEQQIGEVGRRLARAAPRARVILFGSHARGDAGARSDVDILVIEPEVDNTATEAVRLMREVRDLRLPIEVVVVSEREAESWRHVRGSLVHAAVSDGRVLAG